LRTPAGHATVMFTKNIHRLFWRKFSDVRLAGTFTKSFWGILVVTIGFV
jgi:hypothetical protein